jgi:hypothetical protein
VTDALAMTGSCVGRRSVLGMEAALFDGRIDTPALYGTERTLMLTCPTRDDVRVTIAGPRRQSGGDYSRPSAFCTDIGGVTRVLP